MNQEIFDREIAMCRKLSQENGRECNWGECKTVVESSQSIEK